MPVVRWRPLSDMDHLRREMDQRFHHFHHHTDEDSENFCDCYPLVDIKETKDDFVIFAELPAVSKNDVKINIADDILTVSSEKKSVEKEEGHTFHRVERNYGKFQRNFTLPVHIDGNKVKASFKDGVLAVTLPKKEEKKPKEISISVS